MAYFKILLFQPMVELDFSNIYSSTGKILQVQYAQKAADTGSTILAMCNRDGVVILVVKPVISPLHVQASDHRIKKMCNNTYIAYTGLLNDGMLISDIAKKVARDYVSRFRCDPPVEFIKRTISDYIYMFTEYSSSRVIGAKFLVAVRDKGSYKVLSADCSGKVTEYYAFSCGAGHRRAQTELEKLDLGSMNTNDMIDQGIRILFRCHDPLSDVKFNVEAGFMSGDSDGEFVRVDQSKIDDLIEKYKDISIDDEE